MPQPSTSTAQTSATSPHSSPPLPHLLLDPQPRRQLLQLLQVLHILGQARVVPARHHQAAGGVLAAARAQLCKGLQRQADALCRLVGWVGGGQCGCSWGQRLQAEEVMQHREWALQLCQPNQ